MKETLQNKTIRVLKLLLKLDDLDIVKCSIESLLEELEDANKKKGSNET